MTTTATEEGHVTRPTGAGVHTSMPGETPDPLAALRGRPCEVATHRRSHRQHQQC
jgi:hypothetical protein